MNLTPAAREQRANSRNALIAGFLGWTLDAFDYFILVFVLVPVARDFHRTVPEIALTLTASLAMRPVGAFLFGLMADRYGRRLPLMLDVIFYSIIAWKATAAKAHEWSSYFREVAANWKRFAYLVLLMALMIFISHGTQDLYPTFLQQQRGFSPRLTAAITVISMLGAIAGGILVGLYSDHRGRRRAMITSVLIAVLLIPLWIFAPAAAWIALGAFLMQFMVQGAWGVIPAHLNELSPDRLRGFFPGFAYQIGVLIASTAPYIESLMSRRFTYAQAMGMFAAIVLLLGAVVIAAGPEAHRVAFGRQS